MHRLTRISTMDIPMRRFYFLYNLACRAFRACFFVAATYMFSMQAHSTVGALDTTFGVNGVYKSLSTPSNDLTAIDSAVQSDQRVVVANQCNGFVNSNICLFRLDRDGGSMDLSFGTNGVATIDFGGSELPESMVVDSRDRVLVGGTCHSAASVRAGCLIRLTADGALDASFGINGRLNVSGMIAGIGNVNVLADGRILVAGGCGARDFCIARILENGNPDVSFNLGASQQVILSSNTIFTSGASALAIDGIGRIYVTGGCSTQDVGTSLAKYCVVRLTAAGVLDASFNGTGIKVWDTPSTHPLASSASVTRIAVSTAGQTFVSAACSAGDRLSGAFTGSGVCVSALTDQGALDTTFSAGTTPGNGFRYVPLTDYQSDFGFGNMVELYLSDAGSILLVNHVNTTGDQVLVRLKANGALDGSFGSGGILRFRFNGPATGDRSRTNGSLLTADRRLILSGTCYELGSTDKACLSRYDLSALEGERCSLDLDDDGKILPQTDGVMWLRIMLGFRGAAVMQGAMGAASDLPNRTTWPQIQSYLFNHCGIR
jgi:uncharacterized delta-60 repeat protein